MPISLKVAWVMTLMVVPLIAVRPSLAMGKFGPVSCSERKALCFLLRKAKNRSSSSCNEHFSLCMKTGKWTDSKGRSASSFRE